MKNNLLVCVLAILFVTCKKDDNDPDKGKEEGKSIENTLIGHNYKISSITDQNGADARNIFPECLTDDSYLIKDRGTVQISQGGYMCGTHTQDTVNASWGIGYGVNSVTSLFFPVFIPGYTTYKTNEFIKPLFRVNTTTGAIDLIFKVSTNTYTITLVNNM